MTVDPTTTSAPPGGNASPAEIERDIEQTRADLGETIDELTARLDPKARAREAVGHVKESVRQQSQTAKSAALDTASRVRNAATDEAGQPMLLSTAVVSAIAGALVVAVVFARRRR